jgi:hypothetical protein
MTWQVSACLLGTMKYIGIDFDHLHSRYIKLNSTIRFSSTRRIEWYKNKLVLVKFKL